jgi:aspartate ammonia-lyase
LSDEEQAVSGFCINGILDLSNNNESSQKKLFTNDQWSYLNKYLGSKKTKYLPKLSNNTEEKIKEIINQIKRNEEEEAYYVALESVRGAHPDDKWIFKVLGHV